MNKLWIFTLTWNACDKLTALKESLLPALDGIDYTWLIKDNASKDNTVEIASNWGNNIQLIPYKNNMQNFSTGMNYLFNIANPKDNDLILLLNNDVIFRDTKSIKSMINLLKNDSDIGVVGARLLYNNTNLLQHAGVVFHTMAQAPMHFRLNEFSDLNAEKNREFQVVTGAVLLTTGELYRNVYKNTSGNCGMDEDYHWAFDDVDLCLAIKYNLQKRIIYCGNTNIFHEESVSLKKNPTNKLFSLHNINRLKNKWLSQYKIDQDIYTNNSNYNLYTG
jgi:GT2 family glycosyltransferase